MSDFASRDDYQKCFNPRAYLEMYFRLEGDSMGDEHLQFVLRQLAEIFHSGLVTGETLIDLGTGPTIYTLLSACDVFKDIIVSDFTDSNREEFKEWLLNRPGAFDWSPVVKLVCHLEGDKTPWTEKEACLRKAIKQVVKCDILKSKPIEESLPMADCIISSLCLESACKDQEQYVTALTNISTLLKPGGHMVITGVMGNTFYTVGDLKFPCLYLTEDFVRESVEKVGFTIVKIERYVKTEESVEDLADFMAYCVLVARKSA